MENKTAVDEAGRIAFANLKYQIGSILAEKFLEYNDGKFHTTVELNPATHAITEFVFNASLQCAEMKKENETWRIGWNQLQETVETQRKRIEELEAFLYRLEANPESGEAWIYTEAASLLMDIKSNPHDTINKP